MDTFPNAKPQSPGESAAVEHARHSVDEVRASAQEIASKGSEALHSTATRAREAVSHTTDQATHYVQEQPLKSLLMAAVAGATIALLAGALSRRHEHH
ncbi:MAG: hypothetical protein ACSLEZ_05765 [Thiobacillus sp.]